MKTHCEWKRCRHVVCLVLTLFLIIGLFGSDVFATTHYSLMNQPSTTISAPPIILQSGSVGNSIIYTNNTSARTSVAAPLSGDGWGAWSDELLVNPGFEMGNLSGWTAMGPAATSVGVFNATSGGDSYTQKNLRIGSYGVCTRDTPGTNDDSGVWQNVSVGGYAYAIDGGNAVINASGWLYPSEWTWDDCALIVRFYNSAGGFISAWNTTGEYGSGTAYYPKAWMLGSGYSHFTQGQLKQFGCYNYTTPVGTRTVGIQLGMGEHKDAASYCGGQADEASIKIRTKNMPIYDYVLRAVNQVTNAWNVSLQVSDSSNVYRLSNATISFHDGTSSNQITIRDGSITQPQGSLYNLPGGVGSTAYISISNLLANATGISYLFTYLQITTPNTTTYALYTITFEIT
jgi:hypothetical protein